MYDLQLVPKKFDDSDEPVIFVDTEHIIRYQNKSSKDKSRKKDQNLIGNSLLDCHNETSQKMIISALEELQNGADSIFTSEKETHKAYIQAVRRRKQIKVSSICDC